MSEKADCMCLERYLYFLSVQHSPTAMVQIPGSGNPPSWLYLPALSPLRMDLHELLTISVFVPSFT